MKARNGILALLAALALASCVGAVPTEPGVVAGNTSVGPTTTTSDTTDVAGRGITTIGSGN